MRRTAPRRRFALVAGLLAGLAVTACGAPNTIEGGAGASPALTADEGPLVAPVPPSTTTGAPTTTAPASPDRASGAVPRAAAAAWSGTLPAGGVAAASPALVPVRISIPRLGVDAAVLVAGTTDDGSLALPANAADAAWVAAGVTPGAAGSSVIAAHVDYDGARGPFFAIDTLAVGDHVAVRAADGTVRTFSVRGPAERLPKVALAGTDIFRRTGDADLVLVTCGGRFDPVTRSYEDNVLVRARLIQG